ncbi:hypothetical protein AB0D59_48125 [Streptomyces sp. NPDC048417]|uniref:hypothetical protein n=1 Tax=Streptomyces sp. NPDC048417 TaxID=3155387 RepID=UPI0034272EBA
MSRQSAASAPELSTDPRQRMGDYQTMAVNARMRIYAILAAAGLEPDDADELVCSVEAGAVAGGHCRVEEKFAMAPDSKGEAYGEGWDGGVSAATATLVSTADSAYRQRGRALTTSAAMKLGEIIHNRLQAAEKAGPAETTNSGEGGRSNV